MGKISGLGMLQKDAAAFLKALRNRCFSNPALAVGTTTTRIQIANALSYMIDGVLYSKSAEDDIVISTLTATAAAQNSRVRVELNTAGTVSFVQGGVRSAAPPATPREAPARTASRCTIGYFDLPASFTPGTSLASLLTFVNGDPDLNTDALAA